MESLKEGRVFFENVSSWLLRLEKKFGRQLRMPSRDESIFENCGGKESFRRLKMCEVDSRNNGKEE
jgi:hypothetical protein